MLIPLDRYIGKNIYLACPYSHSDRAIRIQRANQVTLVAATLMAKGIFVFSPITHGHAISELGLVPSDWAFWKAHCCSFLDKWADALFVVTLSGWDESIGVLAEMKKALAYMPIEFLEVDGCNNLMTANPQNQQLGDWQK